MGNIVNVSGVLDPRALTPQPLWEASLVYYILYRPSFTDGKVSKINLRTFDGPLSSIRF